MTEKELFLKDSGIFLDEIAAFDSDSYEETLSIASSFAGRLKEGDTVLLTGELGSGKTAFTTGIADVFNCSQEVCSPSFKLINKYSGKIPLYHMDFYRIKNSEEIWDIGIEDIFLNKAIFIIEWPEIFIKYFKDFYYVSIDYTGAGKRKIKLFKGRGPVDTIGGEIGAGINDE